jgi:hypothetical protein
MIDYSYSPVFLEANNTKKLQLDLTNQSFKITMHIFSTHFLVSIAPVLTR